MITSNIRILVNNQQLDYISAEGLGISFNRIVDDLQDLSARFGEFTYSFDVPQTKNNNQIFSFANSEGRKGYFKITQNLPCKVYNGTVLLLDGVLNLNSVNRESYSVTLYSKFKEFIDDLEGKTLQDLQFTPISGYDYEDDIIRVINSGVTDCDDNLYVYPYVMYGTQYCPTNVFTGLTDNRGDAFEADQSYQNFYYTINSRYSGGTELFNYTYHHQIPMSLFMVRVVQQIFDDAGWKIGGTFWNNSNIKRIVVIYTGDDDVYDRATQQVSGATATQLTPATFLPDMDQEEFLSGIIKMFNLYFEVDVANKIIKFNTWDTLFGNAFNPYDITGKVFDQTVKFSYNENNNPTIRFEKQDNDKIMGESALSTGYTDNASTMVFTPVDDNLYDGFFNRIGDKNSEEINIPFGEPNVCRHFMWNAWDKNGASNNAPAHTVFLPVSTDQTPTDNNNKKFNKNDKHTRVFNTEDSIKFKGESTLMYWYGTSNNDFENFAGDGDASNYYYINIPTGVSAYHRTPIGFCSPFQLIADQTQIETYMASASLTDRRTITGTYLRTIWTMMGNSDTDSISGITTDFSLVFDDNRYFHNTLWSKFHFNKWNRYQNSEILEATMRMTDNDWREMKISRAIMYNKNIYHIVSIEGYSPVTQQANIKLIKKL